MEAVKAVIDSAISERLAQLLKNDPNHGMMVDRWPVRPTGTVLPTTAPATPGPESAVRLTSASADPGPAKDESPLKKWGPLAAVAAVVVFLFWRKGRG